MQEGEDAGADGEAGEEGGGGEVRTEEGGEGGGPLGQYGSRTPTMKGEGSWAILGWSAVGAGVDIFVFVG